MGLALASYCVVLLSIIFKKIKNRHKINLEKVYDIILHGNTFIKNEEYLQNPSGNCKWIAGFYNHSVFQFYKFFNQVRMK